MGRKNRKAKSKAASKESKGSKECKSTMGGTEGLETAIDVGAGGGGLKFAPIKGRKKKTRNTQPLPTLPAYTELDYWHGNLPNEDTANLLKEDGQFLLRKDLLGAVADTVLLSVRTGKQVANGLIKELRSGYRIGDREFPTVSALVDYYQIRKIPIKLSDELDVTLGNPVRRKAWELRNKMLEIGKELGSGSFGVVFAAQLTFPRKKPIAVAAKRLSELDADSSLALWKEARIMQEYDHPNITKFYGVCNDSLPYYLVMELIAGGSVDKYLEDNPGLSLYKRAKIATEAAAGLEYLHANLCIHRDIAARNMLIAKVAKVSDFGLTRKSGHYKVDTEKPMNLRWIAPDVYKTSMVTKATDVYAFGITLYELFVVPYQIPYADWEANEVHERVIEGDYRLKPPREMPKEIANLMKECLMDAKVRPSFKIIWAYLAAHLREMEKDGLDQDVVKKSRFRLW